MLMSVMNTHCEIARRGRRSGFSHAFRLSIALAALFALAPGALIAQVQDTAQVADTVPADTIPPGLTRAREILLQMDAAADSIVDLESQMLRASGQERELIRLRGGPYVERVNDLQAELVELIGELGSAGLAVDSLTLAYDSFSSAWMQLYERAIRRYMESMGDLRAQRASTPPEGLGELEARIREAQNRLDTILARQMDNLVAADSIGIDLSEEWTLVDRFLAERAESQVGRLQIAVADRERLEAQIRDAESAAAPEADIAPLRLRLQVTGQRVRRIATSLQATADLMATRGFETDQYRQFVIRATGEVTGDVLDPGVMLGLLRDLGGTVWRWFRDNAPTLLVRLLMIVGFIILFRTGFRIGWWVYRKLGVLKLSRLLTDMVSRMLRPIATLLGLVTGLWTVGVNPAALLAGLGVAGIIIGLALQDSLANLAAGMFILATRPYDVDDVIEAGGVLGTVRAMGLASTTVVTFDNRRLMIPNRKIWGEVIENRSVERVRRVDVTVRIGYGEDLDRAIGILHALLDEQEKILETPTPSIFVSELADSWIELAVRPWVRNEDWWPLLTELPRLIRLRFLEEGIEIPYPRREVVRLKNGEREES